MHEMFELSPTYEGLGSFEVQTSYVGEGSNKSLDEDSQSARKLVSKAAKKCYHCGKSDGHKAADCPVKKMSDHTNFEKSRTLLSIINKEFPSSSQSKRSSSSKKRSKLMRSNVPFAKPSVIKKLKNKRIPMVSQRSKKGKIYRNVVDLTKCDQPNMYQSTCNADENGIYNFNMINVTGCTNNIFGREEKGDEKLKIYGESDNYFCDSKIEGSTCEERRNIVAFTRNMVDQSTDYNMGQKTQANQVFSAREALIKILPMTVKTEIIKLSVEECHGYYLAKNVHILDPEYTYQTSVVDEMPCTCTEAQSTVAVNKGVQIGFGEIRLMLSAGIREVTVHKKMRVVILSFGDEIVNWDSSKIDRDNAIDSNGPVSEAMVRECGGEIVERKHIRDGQTLREEVQRSLFACDMLLLNGGRRVFNHLKDLIRKLTRVQVTRYEQALLFPMVDFKSGNKKIVFGLSGCLRTAIITFHLLVKPLLEQMMGSAMTQQTLKIELGEDFSANDRTGEYHPVYFHENKDGIIVAKSITSVRRNTSLVGADGLVHLSFNGMHKTNFIKGTVVDVVPLCKVISAHFVSKTWRNVAAKIQRDQKLNIVTVGVITTCENSKENLTMMAPLIKRLFSRERKVVIKNQIINELEFSKTLMCWTNGDCAKQVIFTIDGTSQKENINVRNVSQKLVDRELEK